MTEHSFTELILPKCNMQNSARKNACNNACCRFGKISELMFQSHLALSASSAWWSGACQNGPLLSFTTVVNSYLNVQAFQGSFPAERLSN